MMVSVIMITYGHEKFIEQAINGVLMQECDFEVELILANDCSPDQTNVVIQGILENHPRASWIKYIKHERNLGMMPNFIFAMQQCAGEYIALCEGDDYWTDSLKLQKQVDFLEVDTDYVLCFHKVDILETDGKLVDDFITKVPENYETIETLAQLGNYIHTPSVVFRNIIKEFPFEFEVTPIGDYFLYMILAEHGKLKYIEEKMAVYRHGVGFFSGNSNLKMAHCSLKFFTCLGFYLKNDDIKRIVLNRHFYAISTLENIINNQYSGNFISNHIFFRLIKFINENYKQPSKILKKIILKVFK